MADPLRSGQFQSPRWPELFMRICDMDGHRWHALILSLTVSGCAAPTPAVIVSHVDTGNAATQASGAAKSTRAATRALGQITEQMTEAFTGPDAPLVASFVKLIHDVIANLTPTAAVLEQSVVPTIIASAKQTQANEKQIVQDAATIAKLRAAAQAPFVKFLYWLAGILVVGFVVCGVLAFIVEGQRLVIRSCAGCGVFAGACAAAAADFDQWHKYALALLAVFLLWAVVEVAVAAYKAHIKPKANQP